MVDDSELANPFSVAVFTVISNLSFICLFFGLFNTETDDQWSKRFSLKVSVNIYNRTAIALQTGFADKTWLLTQWPQQYSSRKYLLSLHIGNYAAIYHLSVQKRYLGWARG